jgi:hypothetical protein
MAGVSVWAVSVGGIFPKLDFHFHRIATDAYYYIPETNGKERPQLRRLSTAGAHLRKVFSGAADHLREAVTDVVAWQSHGVSFS